MRAIDRIVATMQIVGASSGFVVLFQSLLNRWPGFISLGILVAMLGFLGFSFLSGILLWNGERRGYLWSIIVQAAQVPFVISSVFSFKFVLGTSVTIGIFGSGGVAFEFGSVTVLTLLTTVTGQASFGLNVVAGIILAYLVRRSDEHLETWSNAV